jgi:hypothetical protein
MVHKRFANDISVLAPVRYSIYSLQFALTGTLVDNLDNDALVVLLVCNLHTFVAAFELVHGHSSNHRVNRSAIRRKTVAIIAGSILQVIAGIPVR